MAFDDFKRKHVDETGSYTGHGRPDDKKGVDENEQQKTMDGGAERTAFGQLGSLQNQNGKTPWTGAGTGAGDGFGAAARQMPAEDPAIGNGGMAADKGIGSAGGGIGEQIDPVVREKKIGAEQLRKARMELMRYKAGKASLDQRIIASEQWWKMRHWEWMHEQGNHRDTHYTSAWLFNCIINRHADAISSYPAPNILPREPQDKETARILSEILPCIMEANDFEEVYSEVMWQKLKQGTGCYGIFWDKSKLGGLGDISIRRVELLNLFWEPGIRNIQESRNLFHVELVDDDLLKQQYPELADVLTTGNHDTTVNRYLYDDNVDTTGKSAVIDWYYHTWQGMKKTLQYCKFVGDTVIYASEDDHEQPMEDVQQQIGTNMMTGEPAMQTQRVPMGNPIAEEGWYAHGEYPFVFDVLFPIEGSPAGFGYVDVCKSSQEQIDRLNKAIIDNAIINSTPRYFVREDGGINEAEFADITRPFVHVNSNLGEDTIRAIQGNDISGNYITILNNKITELKETSNNTDSSNGITSGVTAASGIAAQQEAAGKVSRASTMSAYRAYTRVVNQCVELIRQFYDVPRQFRVAGESGNDQFVGFDNSGMQPQAQGIDFGQDMGFRKPVFDIKVSAQSKTVYTKNSQNELAMALNNMGVFNPQMVDQSLLLLDAMDFEGKDRMMRKIAESGTMQQMFAQVSQIALELANRYDPAVAQQLAQIIMQRQGVPMPAMNAAPGAMPQGDTPTTDIKVGGGNADETKGVKDARQRAATAGSVAQ